MAGTAALDALSDAVFLLDGEGCVLEMNAGARDLFPGQAAGERPALASVDVQSFISRDLLRLAPGQTAEYGDILLHPQDRTVCLNVRGARIASADSPGVFVLVMEDVTVDSFPDAGTRAAGAELETQLQTARRYQEALFTHSWRDDHISCMAEGRPAYELSGDFFEIGRMDNKYLFVMGDVQSHGIEVAIKAITLQHFCRINLESMPLAAQLMQKLNRFVFADQFDTFWSCCMFIGCYDRLTRRLYYSRAGMPEPFLLHPDGSYKLLNTGDTPLGYFEEEHYRNGMAQISPGDRLVMYSDGVTESLQTGSGDMHYGQDRLLASAVRLSRAAQGLHIFDGLIKEVEQFHGGKKFADDFTLAEILFC